MLKPAASFQPLSKLFNGASAASAVGSMQAVDTSFQDTGAPAAQTEVAHVDPMTKGNQTTQGKGTAWHNPVAGRETFMNWGDDNQPSIPQSMAAM